MSTPTDNTSLRPRDDPLSTPRPSRSSPSRPPADDSADPSPLSFKRRAPGKQAGLFTGLLSSSKPVDALDAPATTRRIPSHASALRRWSNAIYGNANSPAPSPASRRREGKEASPSRKDEQPEIPHVLPISAPAYSTPLPKLPMLVLCISMIGEFLSASTPAAFMFFMVESFLTEGENKASESEVGLWTGNLASVFFLAQFLTSLLWASAAQKHGRRAVLFVSLLGNALTLCLFGWSSSLGMAFCARAGQGLFNGSVGVARGAVRDLVDPTNEGRAYSLLGVCWGLGGIVGPILGGLLEHPARNYPSLFGNVQTFQDYPYLLPCIASGTFALVGSMLSLCLSYDGGPREGGIRLPGSSGNGEKDVEAFARRLFKAPSATNVTTTAAGTPEAGPSRAARKSFSQMSAMSRGTAYGYEPRGFRSRLGSTVAAQGGGGGHRVGSMSGSVTQYAPDYEDTEHIQGLNFAQRLLLSNEPAVFSITDVWVAAATREDDQYSMADYASDVFDEDDEDDDDDLASMQERTQEEEDLFGYEQSTSGSTEHLPRPPSPSASSLAPPPSRGPSAKRRLSPRRPHDSSHSLLPSSRRTSIPAVFQNLGLEREMPTSPGPRVPLGSATSDAGFFAPQASLGGSAVAAEAAPSTGAPLALAPIPEGKPVSPATSPGLPFPPPLAAEELAVKPRNPMWDLPLFLIAEYAVLALHGTSCDQIFMSFLVTPVAAGGLGLNASHYAELVAVMCFCQIMWQFKFYPSVGPPRGKLSHLAMFRLGLFAYIPVYLLFPTLRALLNENTNALVMTGMIILSAFRYLANVCAYTAVMILTNAMTPPHLTPLANGLAQSAASAARFMGPLIGGVIWSWSITGGPEARAWPFNYAFGFYFIGAVCSLGLVSSFFLK